MLFLKNAGLVFIIAHGDNEKKSLHRSRNDS